MVEPLIEGNKRLSTVTQEICGLLESRPTALWWSAFLVSVAVLLLGATAVAYQITTGIGTWGLNNTVGWGFDITNFVFWVGIGHAGTLISAILFLFRQRWRISVNRAAEGMTLIAVICAGLFPLIHMGRPWLAFWIFPYPNSRGPLWINFRSPLAWDAFAIGTYFLISLAFWYVGLLPDLATIRDRTRSLCRRRIFGFLSLGWNGAYRTWHRYEVLYLLLAGLATPLVLSVHTIVSFDFAVSLIPGWHTTVLPPYFVAGAILSGMAMVLTLMIIARKVMAIEDYITIGHIESMSKLVIMTSLMVGFAYSTEFFTALYSANEYEQLAFINRAFGPMGWSYWVMVGCNVLIPQLLWFKRIRRAPAIVFVISIAINIGMWFERFVIIVTSLDRSYLPSTWAEYIPTPIELATLAGSFGLFFTLFLLVCRFLPVVAMSEVKAILLGDDAASEVPLPESGLAVFESERDVVQAARSWTERGHRIADVFSPYAVHGLARALNLKPSRLSWLCLALGVSGSAFALIFQQWASAVNWPINVGGKPWNSLPAFVPIAFETGILLAGLGTVFAFLALSGLYPGRKAAAVHPDVTNERFVIVLEGAAKEAVTHKPLVLRARWGNAGIALLVVLAVGAALLRWSMPSGDLEMLPDMSRTAGYKSLSLNPQFADGKTLQPPPQNTISRGALPLRSLVKTGQHMLNPFAQSDALAVSRGSQVFSTFCVPCHGPSGEGAGTVVQHGFSEAPSLTSERISGLRDDDIFSIITYGYGEMPAHAGQIDRDDRWKAVLHVRALQQKARGKSN